MVAEIVVVGVECDKIMVVFSYAHKFGLANGKLAG